jgi:peptidoglycan/xylan/chitin deacetylase (PgdA/CDA1 family)
VSARLAILCYHRVLPAGERRAAGRPYFLRGTAVSDTTFAAHMDSIRAHFDVLAESEVHNWLDGKRDLRRPACWITFDDGYRDVLEHAVPVLARHAFPATMFVTTGVATEPGRWLPADRWYATLHGATRFRGSLESNDGRWDFDLSISGDYARLVDGPERRRYLLASPDEQVQLLDGLAHALAAPAPTPAELYLNPEELRDLSVRNWSVGGHGHEHAILTTAEGSRRATEIQVPRHLLAAHGLSPQTFAYPDGAGDAGLAESVRGAGWGAAVCLGNLWATTADRFLLPRFLASDHPRWIERLRLGMA